MAFIIENYLDINIERAATEHYDIYEADNFNSFTAGACLLGRDMKSILSDTEKILNGFIKILEDEVHLEEESTLINQIIETHKSIKYEIAVEALNTLLQELKK